MGCNWQTIVLKAMIVLGLYPPVIIFLAGIMAGAITLYESAHRWSYSDCAQRRGHLRGFKEGFMPQTGFCLHHDSREEDTHHEYTTPVLWLLHIPWVIAILVVLTAVTIICITVIGRAAYRCLQLLWMGVVLARE